jgi:phage-related protein
MEFGIELYTTPSGSCPVQEFLDDLKKNDPNDFAIILAGLVKLRKRDYHRPPLSKPVGDDLFEMRHIGKLNTRVIYFFMKGQMIIAVHGIRNKASKIPKSDLKIARSRKEDWEKRNSS